MPKYLFTETLKLGTLGRNARRAQLRLRDDLDSLESVCLKAETAVPTWVEIKTIKAIEALKDLADNIEQDLEVDR